MITINKDHIGKSVYGIGTGNNARNGVVCFNVIKVGRKYVELCRDGAHCAIKYDPTTGATAESIRSGYGGNGGYRFFNSMSDINDYTDLEKKKNEIFNAMCKRDAWQDLTPDRINQIHAVIFPDGVES